MERDKGFVPLPHCYGNRNSIYYKFRQWCESGLFRMLLQVINTDAHSATLLELDSTFCKVHQSACSGLKNQATGTSRGGKNTKIHVLINERMQLMNVVLTGGQMTVSRLFLFLPTLTLRAKKFLLLELTPVNQSVIILKSTRQQCAFPIKPTSGLNMILMLNCIRDAILSSVSFSESRIIAILPPVTIN